MAQLFVKIPRERIGVLVGPDGRVKANIEKNLPVEIEIDSETGDITINLNKDASDPSLLFKAKDIVLAVGRGFSPGRAYNLLQDEDNLLAIIDLREIFGRNQSDIKRVKGRIIGKEGKTRRIIEELTEAYVSVYGHTVAIIGGIEQAETAREAITMLIKGSQHATVYKFLQRKRHQLKRRRLELWEGRPLIPEET
ncbi:MAG: KH domain-containing protein [Candidatus Bathyarchaeota archaeon]|nr:KH domain-containing protein [Candidatus Bathyarchaeota archaeon]